MMVGLVAEARAQDSGRRVDNTLLHTDVFRATVAQPFRLRPFIIEGSESVRVGNAPVDTADYSIDYRFGLLEVDLSSFRGDTVVVRYEALPVRFRDVYRANTLTSSADSLVDERLPNSRPQVRGGTPDPFGSSNLRRSGSITRGVIAGNRQDATIESGLRMELSGEIVDGVDLRAVLTDENTPILPEGTTQRLSEIDRVFIEVQSRRGVAQLGDFDFALSSSEFAQFNRKLQGAKVQGSIPGTGRFFSGGEVVVAGATTRGTYRSQTIQPAEGIQGPYRLEGETGERFIIVVPGTEEVYVDGRRLVRGETNDYVIDYATAEISFTPNQIMTANKRIVAEFQYSTNQFTRSLVGTNVLANFGSRDGMSGHLGATYLREADSKDFSQEFGLTSADSALLVVSGDAIATRSGAERVEYDPEALFVQYTRQEVVNPDASTDTVFVAVSIAPAEGTDVFRVRFSRVGSGNGSYVRTGRSVNGILYEYRGPGLGEYDPVRLLPKPRRQDLFDLAGGFSPAPGIELFGNWAHSVNDENRLSLVDGDDDQGAAYAVGGRIREVGTGLGNSRITVEARRRFVESSFRSFNRVRPVEFGRQWGLDLRNVGVSGGNEFGSSEITNELNGVVQFSDDSKVAAEWATIRFGDFFDANRQSASLKLGEEGFPNVNYELEHIVSQDRSSLQRGEWWRQTAGLRFLNVIGNLTPSIEFEQEDRRQRDANADSLMVPSLAFVELRPALAWRSERLEVGGGLDWRDERMVMDGKLQDAATGWTARSFVRYRDGRRLSTDATVGFRQRRFSEAFRLAQAGQNAESVVLRWNGAYRPLEGAVNTSWLYEAQTERTPKLQEIYVRTGVEFGQFVWTDSNGDGVIQLEEFVPETTPNEGAYVRTFVPSDTLFSIIGVQARLRVGLDPEKRWKNAEAIWKRWLSQISTRTTLEVVERSQEQDLKKVYLLDLGSFRMPGTTLNGRVAVRQDVTLFRSRPDVGLDLSFNRIRSLTDLAAGLEERSITAWRASGRVRPVRRLTFRLSGSTENNRVDSESFSSRRYDLRTLRLVPEVSVSASRHLQLKTQVDIARKKDRSLARTSSIVKVPLEVRYNKARRFQLTGRLEVASVTLSGEATGVAQFELTDGRGTGTSWLWSAGTQYAINRYIRANFAYDGRAPSNAPTLHTLRMQVSAIF
jgi:hypothetical protein